jgi:hypothetical protein
MVFCHGLSLFDHVMMLDAHEAYLSTNPPPLPDHPPLPDQSRNVTRHISDSGRLFCQTSGSATIDYVRAIVII